MEVILIKDVKGTGKEGDLVKVSDGFARNMLLPKGMAIEATPENKRNLEAKKAREAEKRAEEKAEASELAKKIEAVTVNIVTKSGGAGKLFGSITSKDIAEALKEQHGIEVDKKKIVLTNPIKALGRFSMDVKVYPEMTAKLTVTVTEEQ